VVPKFKTRSCDPAHDDLFPFDLARTRFVTWFLRVLYCLFAFAVGNQYQRNQLSKMTFASVVLYQTDLTDMHLDCMS